jgi:hypothetical protein
MIPGPQRPKLIVKILLALAGALLLFLLVRFAYEGWQRGRDQKKMQELELQRTQFETQAREWKAKADAAELAWHANEAELAEQRERSRAAEDALKNARAKVIVKKEAYEKLRTVYIDPTVPVSIVDLCEKLRTGLGYACQ